MLAINEFYHLLGAPNFTDTQVTLTKQRTYINGRGEKIAGTVTHVFKRPKLDKDMAANWFEVYSQEVEKLLQSEIVVKKIPPRKHLPRVKEKDMARYILEWLYKKRETYPFILVHNEQTSRIERILQQCYELAPSQFRKRFPL